MSNKNWFLHVSGEALGPFSTALLSKLIQQNRCTFGDFVWTEGMPDWARVIECAQLIPLLPPAPEIPVPGFRPIKSLPTPEPKTIPIKKVAAPAKAQLPIDATVKMNGGPAYKVLNIHEGGLVVEKPGDLEIGADVKLQLESPGFAKPLDMTGVIAREETHQGKTTFGVDFTRMNPAHRRAINQYVEKYGPADNKAA